MPDTMMTDTPTATYRNRSHEIAKLAASLCKAQAAMEGAKKDSTNPHFRNSYADLASVWDAVRKPLTENGLSIIQFPRTVGNGVEIETTLLHVSGEYMSDVLWVPCSKNDAQGLGSAITYGRRYALMAVTGIAPVDDDGNAAVASGKPGAVPSDWVDDAVKDGLVKGTDTRSTHAQTYVPVKDRPTNTAWLEKTRKKVDAAIGTFRLSGQTVETLDAFWKENRKEFEWIDQHMGHEYERLYKAFTDARDAAEARMPSNTLLAG